MPIRPLCTLCGLLFVLGTTTATAQPPPEPERPAPAPVQRAGHGRAAQGTRRHARQRGRARGRRIAARSPARPDRFGRDGYMGLDWARSLQTCLVAWRATGEDRHAQTALIYFKALLDDRTTVGDGKGGDKSATRDSGYAIRALGPYTALAYDWLARPSRHGRGAARARSPALQGLDQLVRQGGLPRQPSGQQLPRRLLSPRPR